MCCCYIRSCCFGCRSLPSGVLILSLLNLVVNITLSVLPWLVITLVDENGYKGWLFILMAADISLAVGAKTKNKVLLLPWMIIYIMHTLLTLVIGPLIIIGSILAATEFRRSNFLEENYNTTRNHIDGILPSESSLDIFLDKLESKAPKDETDIKRISGLVVTGFLPLWYIYCWIAVKSLYRLLATLDTETESNSSRRFPRSNRVMMHPMYDQQNQPYTIPGVQGVQPPQYIAPSYPGYYMYPPYSMPPPY